MKKVLFVNSTMNIGGIESFLMSVVGTIDRNLYEPIFLTYSLDEFDYQNEIVEKDIRIIRISPPNRVSRFKHIKEIARTIKSEGISVVHTNTYFDSLYVIIASLFAGLSAKSVVVHSHTARASNEKKKLKQLEQSMGRYLMGIFPIMRVACSHEAGVALFGRKKFLILRNGIDFDKFSFNTIFRKDIRSSLGVAPDTTLLGHVGRFDYPKNHIFLLEVFAEYHKLNQNSKLVLVGSGILESKINNKIRDLELEGSVILTGDRSDIFKILSAIDVIIFPSIYEGLPVSLIESQASGVPALISDSISAEVALTNLIAFESLNNNARVWANKLIAMSLRRQDVRKQLLASGYGIRDTVGVLGEVYSGKIKV